MGKRESLQFWSTSPTVPAFVAVPSQPRPQLSTYPAPAHAQQQQKLPHYQDHQLTPAEKEKQDYYGDQDHWADAPAYPTQAHRGNEFSTEGRKAAPAALTILQPPRATFTEAPATPSSPAALAFGDEASSVRGKEAQHRANKSMDWSRFSILVKEKERKGEKSSEWLESKQSTWRKYHKLGWLGGIIVVAAVAGGLAYHFTHPKDDVEPTALNLGGFNGERENRTSSSSAVSFAAVNSGSSSYSSTIDSTSSSSTIAHVISTTASSYAAVATSSAVQAQEEEEEHTSSTLQAQVASTTHAAVRVVETTTTTTTTSARAARTTEASTVEASTTSISTSLRASVSSTTSARGWAVTAEDRLRRRFFNPVRIDYIAINEQEKDALVKRAEWEKISWSSPKKEGGAAKAKRNTGGWEETEMMFGDVEEEEQDAAQTLEKRDWRSIEFSRPAVDAELGRKRHLSHRRHERM